MPGRRFHAKSRQGCLPCKARHIKCDEAQPSCAKCARRNEICEYSGNSHPSPRPDLSCQSNSHPVGSDTFDSLDLFLMHCYSVTTSTRLFPAADVNHIWQVYLPVEAQSHSLLRHGILALAALDPANTALNDISTRSLFRTRGLHHQQAGLLLFRTLLIRDDPAERHAGFFFGVILMILSFANVALMEAPATLEDILQSFALYRGPVELWKSLHDSQMAEDVQRAFPHQQPREEMQAEPDIPSLTEALGGVDVDETCRESITLLKRAWRAASEDPADEQAVALFPALVPEQFWEQVRGRQSGAVMILENYAVILKRFRQLWWLNDWDTTLLSAIHDYVSLQ